MTSSSLELPSVAPKLTDEGVLPLLDLHKQGPIRAELLGLERLESQARQLAQECVLGPHELASSPLLDRFVENRQGLVRARQEILARDRDEIHGIDADWLADNFHIIDDVLREVKQDLPRGYDLVLPKLGTTHLAGFPRVYALALTLMAHTDSELDETRINRFVQAFQEVSQLRIGELWALPAMFRLVLLDKYVILFEFVGRRKKEKKESLRKKRVRLYDLSSVEESMTDECCSCNPSIRPKLRRISAVRPGDWRFPRQAFSQPISRPTSFFGHNRQPGYRNRKRETMATPEPGPTVPKAFISYSWDDDNAHKEWVRQLASQLRKDGVDVTLDHWHCAPGDQIPAFMERAVRENDFVIVVCTPQFKERLDGRRDGVGFEGDIMTAYAFTGGDKRRFIPVLRRGKWTESAPDWLLGRAHVDLSGDPYSEPAYEDLLRTLHDAREKAPPVGPRPNFQDKKRLRAGPAPAR